MAELNKSKPNHPKLLDRGRSNKENDETSILAGQGNNSSKKLEQRRKSTSLESPMAAHSPDIIKINTIKRIQEENKIQ